jgi:hypothetical protein
MFLVGLMYVFSALYGWPAGQWVFSRFHVLIPNPRRVFSARVTTSRWSGFTHRRFLHRWSMTRPSGIGLLNVSQEYRWARTIWVFVG